MTERSYAEIWAEFVARFSSQGLHWSDLRQVDAKWRTWGKRAKDPSGLIGLKY